MIDPNTLFNIKEERGKKYLKNKQDLRNWKVILKSYMWVLGATEKEKRQNKKELIFEEIIINKKQKLITDWNLQI